MARFIIRRLGFMALTMLLVSIAVFMISEVAPGDVAKHVLGQFATPEQIELLRDQMGLDQPLYTRYLDWLIGNDWRLKGLVGMPLVRVKTGSSDEPGWWAQEPDGTLKRWKMRKEGLAEISLTPGGQSQELPFDNWQIDENGEAIFWGVDTAGLVVLWTRDALARGVGAASAGRAMTEASGTDYYPLKKGLLRGDPGISVRTNKPVGPTLIRRLRNSGTLAGIAFAFIMPIALVLGIVAGLNEGRPLDRGVS
ncbi:MAG TPA: ABC transporter permease, partial [Anaerolineae bacterium]|nr:ABC transporter permease [Anaerolineae bacterium]